MLFMPSCMTIYYTKGVYNIIILTVVVCVYRHASIKIISKGDVYRDGKLDNFHVFCHHED